MKNAAKLLLGLFIIIIIGFTGWFVWHSKRTADTTLNQANSASNPQPDNKQPQQTSTAKPAVVVSGFTGNTAVQQAKLSEIPELKTTVVAHIRETSSSPSATTCVDDDGNLKNEAGGVTDPSVYYVTGSAAKVAACGIGQLYASKEGQWQYVAATQGSYKCTTLQQYNIPAGLINPGSSSGELASCTTDTNQTATYKD